MRRGLLCLLAGMIVVGLSGTVAGAAEITAKKSVNLKESPDAAWSVIGDFCALDKWHPAVAKCEIVAGGSNKVGTVRVLTLGNGGKIREELVKHDPKLRSYTYKILESPLPVASYESTISVLAGSGGGSVVEWKGTFKAATGTDDATARTTMEGIYEAGLNNLLAKETTK
jgi:mxaD protein